MKRVSFARHKTQYAERVSCASPTMLRGFLCRVCGFTLAIMVVLFGFGATALAENEEENANIQTGWINEGGKWSYVDPATGQAVTGWLSTGGQWYHFTDQGEMQSGWAKIGNTWYYFRASGSMVTGWCQVGGKWYYLNADGAMETGWLDLGGRRYYMKASGAMTVGWQKMGSSWYYFKSSGAMVSNDWLKVGGSWYWFDSAGIMATGTKVIDGKSHSFNSNGVWKDPNASSFAQLAPTTRMSFVELVGDNGNYASIKGYPAKGTYRIVVDLYHQVVMAYRKDGNGNYTVPVRYMVTTTGGPKTPTPVGVYSCKDSRRRFSQFSTGEYAQYWTRVVGEIYFHSLLYTRANANYYMESSYRLLGSRGSHGCIRLLVPDARWVYYNVAPGTTVQIRAGSKNDTATANIKKQLTRAALPASRPNCNGVGNTDVWSIP